MRKQMPAAARRFDRPLSLSPSGGKPGREGSPHAAKSRRLSPQEGFQNAPLKPPLCIPPLAGSTVHPSSVYSHPITMQDRELYRRILGIQYPLRVASVLLTSRLFSSRKDFSQAALAINCLTVA